ncbi:MAG: hypothetical protein KIS81_04600 [Maricaulaceae bacterium]|nr:hypothetical protein [Maricaulaceae bacterium]
MFGNNIFGSVAVATFTIFASFVLATIGIVFIGIQAPDVLNAMLDAGQVVERWLTGSDLPIRYNIWVRWLMTGQQLTFIFFVIIARILIAIVLYLVTRPFKGEPRWRKV